MAESDNAQGLPTADVELHRVAVRVPPFWPEKPELWFCQLESQFHLNGVTQDNTKFWYVVSQLEARYACAVEDIITNPPNTDKYATLKNELVKRLSTSLQFKLKQLLEHEEIGDRTPSSFLRHLKDLAGSSVKEEFLRTLWLNRLPAFFQAILATQPDLTLEKLADLADKIHETRVPAPVSAQLAPISTQNSEISLLVDQVKNLTIQVAQLSNHHFGPRSRSNSRRRFSRPASRSSSPEQESGECWYHRNFGNNAKKCKPGCTFKTNTDSGNATSRH